MGPGMTHVARALHRLTPFRDDPASAWLTPPQRLRVLAARGFYWLLFLIFLRLVYWAQIVLMGKAVVFVGGRGPALVTGAIGVALLWPVRRIILRRASAKIGHMVRNRTPALAVSIDDFQELEQQPDGTLVSLVGWIRARLQITQPVGGEPCIGLALACHQKYPGVLETLNDFDLVDESG